MQNQMPQEIEVWYIIPALRRELAKSLIEDCKLTQKKVAVFMGITEAAVSQYMNSKRAKEVMFSNASNKQIKISAKKIAEEKSSIVKEMVSLTKSSDIKKVMCDIHRKLTGDPHKKCKVCFEDSIEIK